MKDKQIKDLNLIWFVQTYIAKNYSVKLTEKEFFPKMQ